MKAVNNSGIQGLQPPFLLHYFAATEDGFLQPQLSSVASTARNKKLKMIIMGVVSQKCTTLFVCLYTCASAFVSFLYQFLYATNKTG